MKNKNLLIGAGVVVVGYLLWKNYKNKPKDLRSQQQKDCEKQGRNWDSVEKFCGMSSVSNIVNSSSAEKRKEAQSNLDMINQIFTDFNKNSKQEKRNGILYQVDNNGKDIGFWSGDKFTRTDGKDKLIEQYRKNIKDLGFTFLDTKVLTQSEYEIEKNKLF